MLVIRSLDDLKSRLGKVVLMILVVTFFERLLAVRAASPLDVLCVGAGVALVAVALWLGRGEEHPP